MSTHAEDLPLDSNSITNHFFSNSANYSKLQKVKTKPYIFLYYLINSRNKRKNFEKKADIEQQLQVAKCWGRFSQLYFDNQLVNYSLTPKKSFSSEKIVWQYWGQGISSSDLPETVKFCFKSVDKHSGDYTVIRLDDNNIHDYLNIPEFVWKKKQNPEFKHAFFADLLRLALLDIYGGVWLDATIYLSSPLSDLLGKSDFFMYQRDKAKINYNEWTIFNRSYFSWDTSHKINVLNSIIFSKKNNIVIHTCLDLLLNFWETQEYIPHYFFFQIMFDTLINNQLSNFQCEIMDDTRPHLLARVLDEPFDENRYKEIKSQVNIHKLSYLGQPKENSYYQHLLKNI